MTTRPRRGRGWLPKDSDPSQPALGLLVAILKNTPRLRRAACRTPERAALFDRADASGRPDATSSHVYRHARDAALACCRSCPELGPCGQWVRELPMARRPTGVVAAHVVNAKGQLLQHNPKGLTL